MIGVLIIFKPHYLGFRVVFVYFYLASPFYETPVSDVRLEVARQILAVTWRCASTAH